MIRLTIQNADRVLGHLEVLSKRITKKRMETMEELGRDFIANMKAELTKKKRWKRYGGDELRRSFGLRKRIKSVKRGVYWIVSYHPRRGAIPSDRGSKFHFIVNPFGPTWRPHTKRGNAWMHPGSRPLRYIELSARKSINKFRKVIKRRFRLSNLLRG